jgi:hypothetical protein
VLFGITGSGVRLPREFFGVLWWVLGVWLFKSLLDLVLLRTFFPDNDEPHARRLFADLATGLIYVLAFVGIVGTVFKEPVSTFLATSGVRAIVTNHSRPRGPHCCVIGLRVDLAVAPARVIEALKAAAAGSPHLAQGTAARAYACAFNDSLMDYELAFSIDSYALIQGARSAMIERIAQAFRALAIVTGKPATDVRIVGEPGGAAVVPRGTA